MDSGGKSQEPYLASFTKKNETGYYIRNPNKIRQWFLRIGEAGMIEVMTNAGGNKGGQLSLGKEPLL